MSVVHQNPWSMNFSSSDYFNLSISFLFNVSEGPHTRPCLSSGFSVFNFEFVDIGVSDHLMIVFESSLSHPTPTSSQPHSLAHCINPATATYFSNTFILTQLARILTTLPSCTDNEELITLFNAFCSDILNCVVPLKLS